MKTKFISGLAISTLVFALSSCESASKLANNIQGSWSGAPEKLIDNGPTVSSYLPVLTFIKTDKTKGDITIYATVSLSEPSNDNSSLSASGNSTISGKWTATDDDELYINLDPSTINVNIDPDAVIVTTNIQTGTHSSSVDSIKSTLLPAIKARITSAVQRRMLDVTKIDDIKIKNGLMTCEINGQDKIFNAIE